MINKLILSGSYDFGEEPTRLVDQPSAAGRAIGLTKAAGVDHIFGDCQELELPKDHTVVHVIAVGDSERYGANRNGDEFSREDNQKKHASFKTGGHVFRNHRNHDPLLKVGDVLATAHNDRLSRIELLIALDNQKCEDEVQKLSSGKDLPLSMGSRQAFDVCSYCKHRAKTAAEHCSHVRHHLGEVAENGVKVAMLNPDPDYFDISVVFKPADRAAYALRKIGGTSVIGGHELAEQYGLTSYASEKLAAMHRLASIVKEQPALARPLPRRLQPLLVGHLKRARERLGDQHLLGELHDRGLLLSPPDFGEVFLNADPDKMEAACGEFPPDINELVEEGEGPDSLDGCCRPRGLPEDLAAALEDSLSMDDQTVRARVIRIGIEGPAIKKAGSYVDTNELRGLADFYGFYKVAFAVANYARPSRVRNLAATF